MKSIAAALPSNSSMYSAISALNASRVDSKFCSMSSFISSTCQLSSVSVTYPVSHCLHIAFTTSVRSCLLLLLISRWSHNDLTMISQIDVLNEVVSFYREWHMGETLRLSSQQCAERLWSPAMMPQCPGYCTVETRWQDMTNSYCFDHSTPMTMWTICHLHLNYAW